ncbi:MAG: hypothetical protein MZV63_72215 [Marinilabiliales bacterium]|nr:hypothetical protein [Marinilabiliales bacterium]
MFFRHDEGDMVVKEILTLQIVFPDFTADHAQVGFLPKQLRDVIASRTHGWIKIWTPGYF